MNSDKNKNSMGFLKQISLYWIRFLISLYLLLGLLFITSPIWIQLLSEKMMRPLPTYFEIRLALLIIPVTYWVYCAWNIFYGAALLLFSWGFYHRKEKIFWLYLMISFMDHFSWIAHENAGYHHYFIFSLEMCGFLFTLLSFSLFRKSSN